MQNKIPHTNLFSVSGCLTSYAINLYLHDELNEVQKGEIELHLQQCELCKEAVNGYQMANNARYLNLSLPILRKSIKKHYFSTPLTVSGRKKPPRLQQHKAFYYLIMIAMVVALVVIYQFLRVQEVKEAKRFGLQFMEDSLFEPLPVILPNDSSHQFMVNPMSVVSVLPKASLASIKAIALLKESEKVALIDSFNIEVLFLKDGIVVNSQWELKNSSAKKILERIQKQTFWSNDLKVDTQVGKKYYFTVKNK